MIGYRFLHPAEEEMTEASVFYQASSNGLGSDFLDDVQRVVDNLSEHPYLGTVVGPNLRRMLLHRFPFSIIYSVEVDIILVIAVAHYSRRPRYWQDRVNPLREK
jgi:plasmid stabilization system protein ParE